MSVIPVFFATFCARRISDRVPPSPAELISLVSAAATVRFFTSSLDTPKSLIHVRN